MTKRIVNLPKDVHRSMRGLIKSDGTIKKREEALTLLCDYLIFNEEASAVSDISDFVAERERLSRKEITKKAFELLRKDGAFSLSERKKILKESLENCLETSDEINFEGFVNFRTENYIKLLYSAVFAAAEECIAEREYKEMTHLLREAVKNTDSLIKEAHIYGSFIFDEAGNEINKDGKIYLLKPDKMLATLLDFCPQRIYIHYPPEGEIMSAIEAVFSPNVIYIN